MTGKNISLRGYQQDIISRIHEAWRHHRSVMVQMPTGTGKTYVLAQVISEELRVKSEESATSEKDMVPNGSLVARSSSLVTKGILIVAHRIELIAQIKDTLLKFKIKSEELKIESIQTVFRHIDSLDFTPDLIVIDEAHHALAKTYKLLWEKWPEARFLGLTATPCRLNRKGFTDLFDTLVTSWSIAEFIEKGILSSFDYASIYPDSAEQRLIDSLKKRGADGDYQVKEMDEVLNKRPSIEKLYQSMMQFARGKKGIVYAISIDHARQIASYYQEQGINSVPIDSKTPKEKRQQFVSNFKEGKLQVLVNVDIFSEGFDCPDVEFIQLARPTLSLAKYLQQVGRGLRKAKGKESCMLIDNVGLYRVFGLPIVKWDWERMFKGVMSSKLQATSRDVATSGRYCASVYEGINDKPYTDMGLVVSHDELLSKLNEWSAPLIIQEEIEQPLKAWQDKETGKFGFRRGKARLTDAIYNKVYEIRENMATVQFEDGGCGIVDHTGNVLWKRSVIYQTMRFVKDNFLCTKTSVGKEGWLDLYSFRYYDRKPEMKRFRETELLKVNGHYYTRTKRCYTCRADKEYVEVLDCGFHLDLVELSGYLSLNPPRYCILKDDHTTYYRFQRKLADRSIIVSDMEGNCYHVTDLSTKKEMTRLEAI